MDVRQVLKKAGFLTKKSMGQNFLFDAHILDRIVSDAGVTGEDTVLEIGPGAGTLTRRLSAAAKRVVAVELDRELISVLDETLADCDNVTVIPGDFTLLDLPRFYEEHLRGPFRVAANLPYNVANRIIMMLLESGLPVLSLTVLVQREVALRMAAGPGTPDYGALSCFIQYYARPALLTRVPPGAFYPPPKVVSQVVRLDVRPAEVAVKDESLLFAVIRAGFAMRRKTLLNNLMQAFALKRETAERALRDAGLPAAVRGEALSLAQFGAVSDALTALGLSGD